MIIGIDSSRAFVSDKTGTENYSYHVITAMLRLPESREHTFVLFTRPNAVLPSELLLYSNLMVKEVRWPYLWTQAGLAYGSWLMAYGKNQNQYLDVLWIPAHTLPILRNPKIRTVVTIHGLEYQWLPEYKNWLQKWYLPLSTIYAAKYADKLIAVSKFTSHQLQKELHTSAKKIKVIYEGVKQDHGLSIVDRRKATIKYVLFVGTVQPRKNLVALIDAFSRTKIEKLIIAGGIGWMAQEVLRAPSRFGVQEKVIFTGRVSDLELEKLYNGALMYVQPSLTEGFGLPVLEAMQMGVPVISSDGGALSEVVGKAGTIIKLGDGFVERLARAMERVVSDKKLQNNSISMGYERVKEFTWEKTARETLSTLVG